MAISQLDDRSKAAGPNINPARVVERIVRYWYVMVVTLCIALAVAYIVNRYSTRIYPISASIIIRESEENIGAKFLYSNSLINPYRNYYNEFFIMRSFPLLQQVVEDLNLDVSYSVKGEIKTTEQYIPHFPVRIRPAPGQALPYGLSFTYTILSEQEFTLESPRDDEHLDAAGKPVRYRYNDTIQVGGSRLVFHKTGDFNGKWTTREFLLSFNNPYSLAQHYSTALQLKWAEPGSAVVNLYIQGSVPEKERDFLSKFIEYYQRYDVNKKTTIATKSIEFLDRQVRHISDSLRTYEEKIAKLTLNNQNGIARGIERMTTMGESLETEEMQLRLQGKYYDYLEEYMNTGTDFDQVLLPSSLGVSDPVLSGLVGKLVELQFELRVLKDQMANTANPLVQESRERIELYKHDIAEGVRSAREIMKINRNLFRERLKELESGLTTQPEPDKTLANVQRNYKLNEGLYMFLIQKRAEAAISQASTTSDIIVVNNPSAGGPIAPVPLKNYTFALALGLLLPMSIFILMEFFNSKIQSKEDIETLSTVPVIGTIGHNTVPSNLAVLEKPRSYLAESFRALRSNLSYFTEGKDKKVILVTSSISGEGKTFTSINVATVMAFTGKRVILIAGDMRKAEIAKDFEVSNRKGLSLYLSQQVSLEEIITKTKIENLDFIPPGPTPPNPAELYLSKHIEELFTKLLETYDYVIVDSPPVGLVSDALALIPIVDHVLFVARQGYTPMTAISQLQFMVDQGQVQHVSIVLNDITRMGMGYGYKYGYAYDYGYGYRYGQNRYYGKKDLRNGDDVYYG